ncbi:bifunctional (p)ppGpp synthetase/guanosine-3',5'-bis(diphosphate) 3'-pyrophosphohydrolase [bacterium]|nr:bifunctional (p)ppGpp synthetase/guanosine-3',5'-bis(diphosphate) 3'-pyrophosphohydrolase [bacterium]NCQ55866.1 bifunctional (p)ppGpp synthetase/guanosine-3',5'-bis(diphosphate) 3'-pyrophosphohydrolase [Candidatus Parcubacteria bacterium]NCS67574.1 bifunctional (p)ppGpp synthetase/guanosine-3',5'-bis(diphosphate) 3'-pyrophosphohydrolase [Candidatus Peregrinibacteria bacterium]NCS96261.1 bifunctional (p)ppGpp synthetase/guanosine-3',5'-bis(diphosphate) 3'-pyrophosphohydrolase [bacterium]
MNLATTPEYQAQFEQDLNDILYQVEHYYPNLDEAKKDKIKRAYWFAEKAHQNQSRFSGEPYFIHLVAATKILLQIQPDLETICACLLHDVIEDTPVTPDEIERRFGKRIRFLCEGVEKITKVRLQGKERELESLRKLFVAMAKDVRVIFIKLADRIHNLSTLDHVPPEKRTRIARESLQIYVPVADRLGIHEFKTQMEDLCFKNLNPEEYEMLSNQIKQSKKVREKFINAAEKEIRKLLTKAEVEFVTVGGRDKNLYSVSEKLKKKNCNHVSEIHDLLGLRVIVNEHSDCYRVLGLIHSHWKPMPGRFKDYIAVPKANGYQSLHTTVLGLAQSKVPTEIQIRTKAMHLDAEYGPAAHWAYKQTSNARFDEDYLEKTSWIPEDLAEITQIKSSEHFFRSISESLSAKRIHVLTPKGDVKNLPAHSTPIDFAYAIHTDIGNQCFGAKVNGIIKPLNHELSAGDVVDIMTKAGRVPNPEWLKFVKSASARHKIQASINSHTKEDEKPLDNSPRVKTQIRTTPLGAAPVREAGFNSDHSIIIGNESGLGHHFPKCCSPLPHQEIVAYNTRGRDFVIHQKDCKILAKLEDERKLEAQVVMQKKFTITAKDRVGLMRDYSAILSERDIFIWDVKFKKPKNETLIGTFTVHIPDSKTFREAMQALQGVDNVKEVQVI